MPALGRRGEAITLGGALLETPNSRSPSAARGKPFGGASPYPSRVDPYEAFSQTEMCCLLSPVKGSRFQPLQRSRKVNPASCAIRSSSAGQT